MVVSAIEAADVVASAVAAVEVVVTTTAMAAAADMIVTVDMAVIWIHLLAGLNYCVF